MMGSSDYGSSQDQSVTSTAVLVGFPGLQSSPFARDAVLQFLVELNFVSTRRIALFLSPQCGESIEVPLCRVVACMEWNWRTYAARENVRFFDSKLWLIESESRRAKRQRARFGREKQV